MLKNFKINITFRILILITLLLLLVFCVVNTEYYITMFILGVGIIITVVRMVNYVDQTNRDFTAFLLGIKYEDFSATYSGHHKGKSFGALYDAFNQINKKFLNLKADKEANHQYLQTIVEHVKIGLLCLDEEENVFLMNKALQEMLRKPYLVSAASLKQIDPHLYNVVKEMKAGERELIKMTLDDKLTQLAIMATEFKLRGQLLKLISFQNIQTELEERELEAWQKLIRILRHEIMNSIAPIVSLADTMNKMLGDENEPPSEETIQDIKAAIGAIRNRGEGLMHFTETYRNLTRIPPPKFQQVDSRLLIDRLYTLFKPVMDKAGIEFIKTTPKTAVTFQADPELIEQVLVNLIKNALDALQEVENGKLNILVKKIKIGKTLIQVIDNGKGIAPDSLDQIFTPFYTTKEEGSGIGLSLSRQIMRMHKGQIFVQSREGIGSIFSLEI